jgi:hypothetical protein
MSKRSRTYLAAVNGAGQQPDGPELDVRVVCVTEVKHDEEVVARQRATFVASGRRWGRL